MVVVVVVVVVAVVAIVGGGAAVVVVTIVWGGDQDMTTGKLMMMMTRKFDNVDRRSGKTEAHLLLVPFSRVRHAQILTNNNRDTIRSVTRK